MKLCVDCKHFNRGALKCENPLNMETSLVSGLPKPRYMPEFLRQYVSFNGYGCCGPNGNWFEERKEQGV